MFATVDSSGAGSLDLVLYRSWLVRSQCGRTAFRSCRPSLSILEGIARGARYVLSSVLLRAKESLLPSGQAGRRARLSNPADVALQLSVPLGRAQWKPDESQVQKPFSNWNSSSISGGLAPAGSQLASYNEPGAWEALHRARPDGSSD